MKLNNIRKTYYNQKNEVEALKGITLDISSNGITMILGPSGCGKTTLLEIIAGRESYEGTIEGIPNFDYLTQEFNLFEDMTVMDNLIIISRKKKLINRYLKQFGLLEHKDKKAKKLSNGQKKRVQFIRALLHKPGMLLCDEPTSALDYDNTTELMEELKKLSDSIQIIMVTHDIALAEKYADRIIKMDQGVIVSDTVIVNKQQSQLGNHIENKTVKDTLLLAMKKMDSRIVEFIEQVIIVALCGFIAFCTINVYTNVSNQSDYAETFKKAENMIVSVPKTQQRNSGETLSGYNVKFTDIGINDLFDYTDVNSLIEDTPEIIAVESFNSAQYEIQEDSDLEWARSTYDLSAYNNFSTLVGVDGMEYQQANYPEDDPYIIKKDFVIPEDWTNYVNGSDEHNYVTGEGYPEHSKYYVQPFDLVNGYKSLPLLCGEIKEDEGVILSKNAADLLMEIDGYQSYEEMIGQTMKLALRGYQNDYWNVEDFDIDVDFASIIDVTINAISSVENDYTTMIFFNNGYGHNPVYNYFVKDLNNVKMEYVRFILEPGSDYQAIAKKIDSYFHKENVDIMRYQGKGLGEEKHVYQSPIGLAIYGIVSLGIIVVLVTIINIFRKKRNRKEMNIMHIYGYSPMMERIIHYIFITIVSCIFAMIVMNPISGYINNFASEHYYQPFMTSNILLLVGLFVVIMIMMILIETIIIGKRKYS